MVDRRPDPEKVVPRVDHVRYMSGAPEEWATWLHAGDIISLVTLGGGIAVERPSGRGFLPLMSIQRIDLDDPAQSWRHGNNADWGKMTICLMNMGALQALPRRPLGSLTITVADRVLEFDVSQRTWPDEALITPEVEATLLGGEESVVQIRDGSYRWISVKRFTLPTEPPQRPSDAIRTLLGHPSYWDAYIGDEGPSPHIHGPYRLEAISPENFRTCDALTAMRTIEEWLHRDGPVSPEQIDGSLPDTYRMIGEADTCLRLPDLGEEARNDFWFILDKPFIEFVLVGPQNRLTLIVASGD